MSTADQKRWEALGWTSEAWDSETGSVTDDKDWHELSLNQQRAAAALGFTAESWDNDWDESSGGQGAGASSWSSWKILGILLGAFCCLFPMSSAIEAYKWNQAQVTAEEREAMVKFMAGIIEKEADPSWKKTSQGKSEASRQAKSQATTVLRELRKVFMAVHELDPEYSEDGDELLITSRAWESYCEQEDVQQDWAPEHDSAIKALFRVRASQLPPGFFKQSL